MRVEDDYRHDVAIEPTARNSGRTFTFDLYRAHMASGVQASRDGDRFHYVLVAHRLLRLLDFDSDLTAISVEEVPTAETGDGDEVVDFIEYYGGRGAAACSRYTYAQVKHSTLRVDQEMTASDLTKTLKGFKAKHADAITAGTASKLMFEFVSNRTLQAKVARALEWLAGGKVGPSTDFRAPAKTLAAAAGFDIDPGTDSAACAAFFSTITVNDSHIGLRDAEEVFRNDLDEYLPGTPGAEMRHLVERVGLCATSLETHRLLERADVLVVLRTSADKIFPAPSALESPARMLITQAVTDTAAAIIGTPTNAQRQAPTTPQPNSSGQAGTTHPTTFLVTATGGTGKSVFSSLLGSMLPAGSLSLTYDCFALGNYRKATSFRHLASVGLTQLSNELAQADLCTPLIPGDGIAERSYLPAFLRRVQRAASTLDQIKSGALLCIVADAGDNAAMTAKARGHDTFVDDILNVDWPSNVRLVVTCRPERSDELHVPSTVQRLSLAAFTVDEVTTHLRESFPDAVDGDGRELHELSSQGNPRVLRMALANARTVEDALARLRIAAAEVSADVSTGIDHTLNSLLRQQVDDIVDNHELTHDDLTRLGRAVAVLPPAIPLDVLAQVAGLDINAIRSFAANLGRGIHTSASTFQFRDEPTETWFRTTYYPTAQQLTAIIDELRIVTTSSAYVAQTLPQLLLEAGLHDDLVALALSEDYLPGPHASAVATDLASAPLVASNGASQADLQAQHIARSRTKYALSALLRMGRLGDAAVLAVRAGRLSGGHSRRMAMFRANPDLTAKFVEAEIVAAMCANKEFSGDFIGSHLHVEAAVLSGNPDTHELARSRARTAVENFVAVTRPSSERNRRGPSYDDAATLALAYLNVDGADATVEYLRRWPAGRFRQAIARSLFVRLADAGRFDDISSIAFTKRSGLRVQVAAAEIFYDFGRRLDDDVTLKLARKLNQRRRTLLVKDGPKTDGRGVTWVLLHALNLSATTDTEALRIIDLHLPPTLPTSASPNGGSAHKIVGALLGHALRAYLRRETLAFDTITPQNILERLHGSERDTHAHEFSNFVSPLLTWVQHLLEANLRAARTGVASTATLPEPAPTPSPNTTATTGAPAAATAAATGAPAPPAGSGSDPREAIAGASRATGSTGPTGTKKSTTAGAVAEPSLSLADLIGRLSTVDTKAETEWNEGRSAWHGPLAEAVARILVASDSIEATDATENLEPGDVAAARKTFSTWYDSFATRGARVFGPHVRVAQIACRHRSLAGLGLNAVAYAADRAMLDVTSSESRVESLIRVARAALALSEDEAQTLFNQAITQADLVGDDLDARTNALLRTAASLTPSTQALGQAPGQAPADAPDGGRQAARAYRLFQIAEKLHHEGEGISISSLASRLWQLDKTLALAAASRARDRRTLPFSNLAVDPFIAGVTSPDLRGLQALAAFTPDTAWREIAAAAQQQSSSSSSVAAETSHAPDTPRSQLATPPGWDDDTWRHTVETIDHFERNHRQQTSDRTDRTPAIRWSDRLGSGSPGTARAASAPDAAEASRWNLDAPESEKVDIAALCATLDFTSPASWDVAFTDRWHHGVQDAVIGIAFDQHVTERPKVLEALAAASRTGMDDFVTAAQTAAGITPQTPALRAARRTLAERFGSRFANRLCTTHYWGSTIASLAAASEMDEIDIMRAAVAELAGTAHELEYGDYFGLAATLATLLGNDTATTPGPNEIFDVLSALFDQLAPAHDTSDGPYSAVVLTDARRRAAPATASASASASQEDPADVSQSLAAFVWCALGDPEAAVRWQAVHAVVLLARLGCQSELATIADLAAGQTSAVASFTDARFTFHDLHARMWLLFALNRISHDDACAATTAPFVPWLIQVAVGTPHAVNQHLAHNIVTGLTDRGLIVSGTDGTAAPAQPVSGPRADVVGPPRGMPRGPVEVAASDLAAISQIRIQPPTVKVAWRERQGVPRALPSPPGDSERLRIQWDFDEHWCEQLARLFPVDAKAVLWKVIQHVRSAHGRDATESYDDPRRDAGVYENRRAYLDHGSWPDIDDLRFYRAFHALMQVAAELRDSVAVFHGEWDDDENEHQWDEWVSRYLPHRTDGRLLADRRDPPPSILPRPPERTDTDWPWSLCPEAFADALGLTPTWTVMWESSTTASGTNDEERAIRTALVSHSTAPALLAAMQTSPSGFRAVTLPAEGHYQHGNEDLVIADEASTRDAPEPDDLYGAGGDSAGGPDSSLGAMPAGCDAPRDSEYESLCPGSRSQRNGFRLTPWIRVDEREIAIEKLDDRGGSVEFPPPGPAQRVIDTFDLTADPDQRTWSHEGRCVIRTTVWQNVTTHGSDRESGTSGIRVEIENDFLSKVLSHLDQTLIAEVGIRRTQYRHYRERNKDVELEYLDWSAKVYLSGPDGQWTQY